MGKVDDDEITLVGFNVEAAIGSCQLLIASGHLQLEGTFNDRHGNCQVVTVKSRGKKERELSFDHGSSC